MARPTAPHLLSRVVVVLMVALACQLLAGAQRAEAQSWGEPWGVRQSTPRSAAAGPLWLSPTVVRGLRSDRYYALVVTGSVKLGEEHYGRYYKGYYGDAGYRWESTSMNQNYPTIAPQRSGVVATDLSVGLSDQSYRENHIYTTGWFVPASSTMTIQLAVRPSRDNTGQIHFNLVELHPESNPNDYTFNTASATWYYNGDFMGRPTGGSNQVTIQDLITALTHDTADPNRNAGGIGSNFAATGVINNSGLFGNGALPPMFEASGTCTDSHQSMFPASGSGLGPADVELGPGFDSTARPGSSGGSTYNVGAINLLDQIASPVYR